jgi:hypothetical protein
VLLLGHGKNTHLFATNKKLTPHLIKINVYTKNKIKTPNHLIIQPNQPSSRHLPPPTARLRRADAAATALSGNFSARKKKKKKKRKDPATGGGRNPPLRPGEIDPATPSGPFCLWRTQKNYGQPTKSFLMPQKSILMPQNSFLMPQN